MKIIMFLVSATLLAACAAQPELDESSGPEIPQWVTNPISEAGLASSSCVPWSGHMTVDRAQAISAARADLTAQIEIKSSVLDRLYMRNTTSDTQSTQGGTFEQVSQQVASQRLQGAVPQEIAMVDINEQQMLCAFVVMPDTRDVFDEIVEQSNRRLDPNSREALYEEFRTQKAVENLERELERLESSN